MITRRTLLRGAAGISAAALVPTLLKHDAVDTFLTQEAHGFGLAIAKGPEGASIPYDPSYDELHYHATNNRWPVKPEGRCGWTAKYYRRTLAS